MAPWSVPRKLDKETQDYSRHIFDRVRSRPIGGRTSAYEQAWHSLSPNSGLPYPSSALLATKVWRGDLSLLLCEKDQSVQNEISGWIHLPDVISRLSRRKLFRGDWRAKFHQDPFRVRKEEVLMIELDPMRFEHNEPAQCKRDDRAVFYIEDLDVVVNALTRSSDRTVIQFSSFSANNNNPHEIIEPIISDAFEIVGLELQAKVIADGNMISLVYSHNVALWEHAMLLGNQFLNWLRA
jgi:hypothetical protein